MSTLADDTFPDVEDVFDSAMYNAEELVCIEAHLGESPGVARAADDFVTAPDSVPCVTNALARFKNLDDMAKSGQVEEWVGFDGIRDHIAYWQERQRRYFKQKHEDPEGKGFHPEMYTFDDYGKANYGGPGSDQGRVRHPLFLVPVAQRSRADFTKDIGKEQEVHSEGEEPEAKVAVEAAPPTLADARKACEFPNKGEMDPVSSYLMCTVCESHFNYNGLSESSKNGAWGQLAKHLNNDQTKHTVEAHRILKKQLFP